MSVSSAQELAEEIAKVQAEPQLDTTDSGVIPAEGHVHGPQLDATDPGETLAEVQAPLHTTDHKKTLATFPSEYHPVFSQIQLQAAAYPPIPAAENFSSQTYAAYSPPPPYTQEKRDESMTVVITQPQAHPIAQGRSMHVQHHYTDSRIVCASALAYCTCVVVFLFGCWWSIPFTLTAVILALTASHAADNNSARKQSCVSMLCSITGWTAVVVVLVVTVAVVLNARSTSHESEPHATDDNFG